MLFINGEDQTQPCAKRAPPAKVLRIKSCCLPSLAQYGHVYIRALDHLVTTIDILRPGLTRLDCPMPRFASVNAYVIGSPGHQLLIDTGMPGPATDAVWKDAENQGLVSGVTDLVCTHMHRDHTGQAPRLLALHQAKLHMSSAEHSHITWASSTEESRRQSATQRFLHMAGVNPEQARKSRPIDYSMLAPFPTDYAPLADGDHFAAGGINWQVIIGGGHSSAGVCLLSEDETLFASGDQILAGAGPHVSVWSETPEADPMGDYFAYLDRLAFIPETTLVLPGHGTPFTNLSTQATRIAAAHHRRLDAILANVSGAMTVQALAELAFSARAVQRFGDLLPGMGMSLANYLWHREKLNRTFTDSGVALFEKA